MARKRKTAVAPPRPDVPDELKSGAWLTFEMDEESDSYPLYLATRALYQNVFAAGEAQVILQLAWDNFGALDDLVKESQKKLSDNHRTNPEWEKSQQALQNFIAEARKQVEDPKNREQVVRRMRYAMDLVGLTATRFKFDTDSVNKFTGNLPEGHLSSVKYIGNVALHKESERSRWSHWYYKNKMKTAADLVIIPDWFNLNDLVDADINAMKEAVGKWRNEKAVDKNGKEYFIRDKERFANVLGDCQGIYHSRERASLAEIHARPEKGNARHRDISNQITRACEATGSSREEVINELYVAAAEKRKRLIGRIDAVYQTSFEFTRTAEIKLLEKAQTTESEAEAERCINLIHKMRQQKLDLARQKYPTDPRKVEAYMQGLREDLLDVLDQDDRKNMESRFKDVLQEIAEVEESQKNFSKRSKTALLREMTCDPGAIALPFGDAGYMVKYDRQGATCFSFVNIPKDQIPNAIATAFKVLNDRGDFWRGDVIIEGPSEFRDQVIAFARSQSLRISAVHGPGTHRLLYEEIAGEIAYDAQKKFGMGVVNVVALVCNRDGTPRRDKDGQLMTRNIAIGSRELIAAGGWSFPKNLLANFMVEDYGLHYPEGLQAKNVVNMYARSAVPMFGVYMSDNDDTLFESKLVNLTDASQNPEYSAQGQPDDYLKKIQEELASPEEREQRLQQEQARIEAEAERQRLAAVRAEDRAAAERQEQLMKDQNELLKRLVGDMPAEKVKDLMSFDPPKESYSEAINIMSAANIPEDVERHLTDAFARYCRMQEDAPPLKWSEMRDQIEAAPIDRSVKRELTKALGIRPQSQSSLVGAGALSPS